MEITLFDCPRMPGGLRLMPTSCAGLFQKGKTAAAWESAHVCRGCEIGALHAGEKVVEPPPVRHCVTCQGLAHRLVHGLQCISCYNRTLEALRLRNAQGQMPRKWRPMQWRGHISVRRGLFEFRAGHGGRIAYMWHAPSTLPDPEPCLPC